MSATNSSTACRRGADPYGAANAARTAVGSGGRDSAVAARTNTGVVAHTACRSAGVRASRISAGADDPDGWCAAVLASTRAETRSRCRTAQPSDTTPPQSCPATTTGPATSSASSTASRSSTRCASVRGTPRCENPIPSWSTATTRQPGAAAATNRRHRYDHVGLPWTHTSVPCSGDPWSSTCHVCPRAR